MFKKNYIFLIFFVLFIIGVFEFFEYKVDANSQECFKNTEGGGNTCLPLEGRQGNWIMHTYDKQCALDFYPTGDPSPGGGGDTPGVDYDKEIYAMWDGVVQTVDRGASSSCGYMIRIESTPEQAGQPSPDGNNYFLEYCHLDSIRNNIIQGARIRAGTLLGIMGSSGRGDRYFWKNTSGSHLHLRVRVGLQNYSNEAYRRTSIPEKDLEKLPVFNTMTTSIGWSFHSNNNYNNHCNIYNNILGSGGSAPIDGGGISLPRQPDYPTPIRRISTGDPSIVVDRPSDGDYLLQTYPTHGTYSAPQGDLCAGALDIYPTNSGGQTVGILTTPLKVMSPWGSGYVAVASDQIDADCGPGVTITYSNRYQITMCHLSKEPGSKIRVKAGERVSAGETIGYLYERTGNATAVHVHLNVYRLDNTGNRIDMLTETEVATLLGIDLNKYPIRFAPFGGHNLEEYKKNQLACPNNITQYTSIEYITRGDNQYVFNVCIAEDKDADDKPVTRVIKKVASMQGIPLQLKWMSIGGVDLEDASLAGIINYFFSLVLWIAIILAFFSLIYVGLLFITSGDNPDNLSEAKERLKKVFIGIVILLSSYIMFSFLGINPDEDILSDMEKGRESTKQIHLPKEGDYGQVEFFDGQYKYIPFGAAVREMWTTFNAMDGQCEIGSGGVDQEKCGGLSYEEGGLKVNEPSRGGEDGVETILTGVRVCIANKQSTLDAVELAKREAVLSLAGSVDAGYEDFKSIAEPNTKINEENRIGARSCQAEYISSYDTYSNTLYTCTGAQRETNNPNNKKDCEELYALGGKPAQRIQESYPTTPFNDGELNSARLDYFCSGLSTSMNKIASFNIGELMYGPIAYYKPAGYGIIDRKLVNDFATHGHPKTEYVFSNMVNLKYALDDLRDGNCSDYADVDKLIEYPESFIGARDVMHSAVREIIHEEGPIRADIFSSISNDDIADYLKGNCIRFDQDENIGMILQTRVRDNNYARNYEDICETDSRTIRRVIESKVANTIQNAQPDRLSASKTCEEIKQLVNNSKNDIGEYNYCPKDDPCYPNEQMESYSKICEPVDIFKCRAVGNKWQ